MKALLLILTLISSVSSGAELCSKVLQLSSDIRPQVENGPMPTRDGTCYGGCWLDANLYRYESLLAEKTGQYIRLSIAHLVMNDLLMQAERIGNLKDPSKTKFEQGGNFIDFSELVERVGLVPDSVMPAMRMDRWYSLVRRLNEYATEFAFDVMTLRKKHHSSTLFGLLSKPLSENAKLEFQAQQRLFFDKVKEAVWSEFPERSVERFDFQGKSWTPRSFADRLEVVAGTSKLITVYKNSDGESGKEDSKSRYIDNQVKSAYFNTGKVSQLEGLMVEHLKNKQPLPAAFYMAYNHIQKANGRKSFLFDHGPKQPVSISPFDNVHAMTIVDYELTPDGYLKGWRIANNGGPDSYYYFDRTAMRKLLKWVSFPYSETTYKEIKEILK
jgi:hypothetical protein